MDWFVGATPTLTCVRVPSARDGRHVCFQHHTLHPWQWCGRGQWRQQKKLREMWWLSSQILETKKSSVNSSETKWKMNPYLKKKQLDHRSWYGNTESSWILTVSEMVKHEAAESSQTVKRVKHEAAEPSSTNQMVKQACSWQFLFLWLQRMVLVDELRLVGLAGVEIWGSIPVGSAVALWSFNWWSAQLIWHAAHETIGGKRSQFLQGIFWFDKYSVRKGNLIPC